MITTDKQTRKETPMARGFLDYFPDACAAVAHLSYIGNQQHNQGEEMHWARNKSLDHADCIVRHLIDRGKIDTDGMRHSAKVAWRALAMLQLEIEDEGLADGVEEVIPWSNALEEAVKENGAGHIPEPTVEQRIKDSFDAVNKPKDPEPLCVCHTHQEWDANPHCKACGF